MEEKELKKRKEDQNKTHTLKYDRHEMTDECDEIPHSKQSMDVKDQGEKGKEAKDK